jgi:hypothetical protein
VICLARGWFFSFDLFVSCWVMVLFYVFAPCIFLYSLFFSALYSFGSLLHFLCIEIILNKILQISKKKKVESIVVKYL